MAAGIFNKIKRFLTGVGSNIKKGLTWANDNIIKPIIKPAISTFAPMFGAPGTAIKGLVDTGSDLIEKYGNKTNNTNSVGRDYANSDQDDSDSSQMLNLQDILSRLRRGSRR